MISVSRPAAAGLIAVAAVPLAACHPPHQVDSEQKIDTATSQKAESLASYGATTAASSAPADATPTIANCGEVELERPTEFNLDCQGQDDVLQNITWDSWGAESATGTGTRVTQDSDAQQPEVAIALSNPQLVNGVLAYTDITVDGTPVFPEGN